MKRQFFFALILIISLVGCSLNKPSSNPGIEGYVINKEGNRILVVSDNPKNFSSTGGNGEFYNAIYFSNAPTNIGIGDKVKVWYDAVAESYPGQSKVDYIEKIPSKPPNGADLTESIALKFALSSLKTKGVIAVKSITYENDTDRWMIKFKNTMTELNEEFDVYVDDK